jgi:hypothetical protein
MGPCGPVSLLLASVQFQGECRSEPWKYPHFDQLILCQKRSSRLLTTRYVRQMTPDGEFERSVTQAMARARRKERVWVETNANLLLNYICVVLVDDTDVDKSTDQKPVELENCHLFESS